MLNERPGLREQVAASLGASDLTPSDIRETHVDRIGALAFADALGGALWTLKWASEARAYPRALALLTHRSKRVCGDILMRTKVCRAVLNEWLDDLCGKCGGRGSLTATPTTPARPCHVCNGSGKRKISEQWRARALGVDVQAYRKWGPRYAAVQRKLVDAELQAWLDIARQLGRV